MGENRNWQQHGWAIWWAPLWNIVWKASHWDHWDQQRVDRQNYSREQVAITLKNLTFLVSSNLKFLLWSFSDHPTFMRRYMCLHERYQISQGCNEMMEQECWRTKGQRGPGYWERGPKLFGSGDESSGYIGRGLLVSPLSIMGVDTCQPPALWLRFSVGW